MRQARPLAVSAGLLFLALINSKSSPAAHPQQYLINCLYKTKGYIFYSHIRHFQFSLTLPAITDNDIRMQLTSGHDHQTRFQRG